MGVLAVCLAVLSAGCGPDFLPGQPGAAPTTQAQDYYPFTAEGFVLRWEPGTDIELELPNCLAPLVAGCQPSFVQAVVDGINVWSPIHSLLGITITVNTVSFTDDVRVFWDDGFGSSGFVIDPGVIGFAAVAEQPAATSRFIVMTTRCNVCGSPPPPHSAEDIRTITAHEWGHMLGVWNHSFDPTDLMFPYKGPQTAISNRDVHTMLKAYTLPPALNLTDLPPNAWSESDGADADGAPGTMAYLIRFIHRYGEVPTTILEFNPPAP